MQKWVSVWGNAVSIAENRPERYAKAITLRYPIVSPFSGSAVRLTFDNYCGTEPVTLEKVTIFLRRRVSPGHVRGRTPRNASGRGKCDFRHAGNARNCRGKAACQLLFA